MYENNYAQIPTYEQAVMISEKYNNFNFKETKHIVDGYNISTFSYFLCEPEMFLNPMGDNSISAINMRGISYVFNKDGSLFKTYLMLPKFFNLNQASITQKTVLEKKKIINVDEKHDGSLIAFIKLPNNKIVSKTINSFDNEQTLVCNKIWEDRKKYFSAEDIAIYEKIIDSGNTLCFEYVSPSNKIVLDYINTELKALGVRCNTTGKWMPFKTNDITDLDYYIHKAITDTGIEGWVLETEDGLLFKIKTIWYCNLHGLYTEDIYREDKIIYHLVKNDCDDFANLIMTTTDTYITSKISIIRSAINQFKSEAKIDIRNAVIDYNSGYNIKDIVNKYKNSIYFNILIKYMNLLNKGNETDLEIILNDHIIKRYTNKLSVARNFISEYKRIV